MLSFLQISPREYLMHIKYLFISYYFPQRIRLLLYGELAWISTCRVVRPTLTSACTEKEAMYF